MKNYICVTLDSEGKEKNRETVNFLPGMGFEKTKWGYYVRKDGDSRFFPIPVKVVETKNEIVKHNGLPPHGCAATDSCSPISLVGDSSEFKPPRIKCTIFNRHDKIRFTELFEYLDLYQVSDDGVRATFWNARRKEKFTSYGLCSLNEHMFIKKIVVDYVQKDVYFFLSDDNVCDIKLCDGIILDEW